VNSPPIEVYRHEVAELLVACVDQRLLYGGTSNAIVLAKEAYDIATANNVPSPWPEFAAYRLAHLKMRSGANEVEALREIDLLFERASRSEKAGPIPLIYRLAVLHRLVQSLIDKNDIAQAVAKSDEVHGKALGLLRRMQYDSEVTNNDRIERQSAAFNMLEFATYMSGRAYQPLEGSSFLSPMDPFREGKWFVVGRNVDQINMTEAMARWEFDDRADKNPDLILIELTTAESARICLSRNREWSVWSNDYAKLVLLPLRKPGITKIDLERKVVGTGGNDPAARFRKAKSRVQKDIVRLTGKPSFEVFDGYHLSDEVPILGLVHGPSFR